MKKIGYPKHKPARPHPSNDPIGKFHRAAIQRVATVPSAAPGFPNTNFGNSDKVIIMKKDK